MTEKNLEKKTVVKRSVVIIGAVLTILNLLIGVVIYPRLPDRVPIHWNAAGEADGWGSAFQGAFMMPILMIVIFLLLLFLPKIDPKKRNYSAMGKAYSAIILVIMLFFTAIYFGTLGAALGLITDVASLVFIGVGVLFVILGNYMGKLKHNYFAGIRTPWTLASEEVWHKTHRMAGPIWVIGGILMMLTGFLPKEFVAVVFFIIIIFLGAVPMVYSFIAYKKLQDD